MVIRVEQGKGGKDRYAAIPRWMEPERWVAREHIKAAGLKVALGELADNGFDVAATCPGCERTRTGLLRALTGKHGRAAILEQLRPGVPGTSRSSGDTILNSS